MLQLVVAKSRIISLAPKLKELELNVSHWAAELWVTERINAKVDIHQTKITITIENNIYIDVAYSGKMLIAILKFGNQGRKFHFLETELEKVLNELYQLTQTPELLAA
jgi:hypothetical protein